MNEIERAINLISEGEIDYSGIYDCELNERVTEVILNALREQVERSKGCEHCRGWDSRCGANYCPMCGRKLEEAPSDWTKNKACRDAVLKTFGGKS